MEHQAVDPSLGSYAAAAHWFVSATSWLAKVEMVADASEKYQMEATAEIDTSISKTKRKQYSAYQGITPANIKF